VGVVVDKPVPEKWAVYEVPDGHETKTGAAGAIVGGAIGALTGGALTSIRVVQQGIRPDGPHKTRKTLG